MSKQLPEDWEEITSDDGQKYYYNIKTQDTTWDLPKTNSSVRILNHQERYLVD